MNPLIEKSLEQGLIFAVLAIGVYFTYKILDIADLSVEGTFPLGAFVFSRIALAGLDPITATLGAFVLGALAGGMTYLIHSKIKINALLSGILTLTILYSFNLRINNTSNVALTKVPTLFKMFGGTSRIVFLAVLVIAIKLLVDLFLSTEHGYMLRITGDNPDLGLAMGKNPNTYKLLGLMLSNGLVAVAGALMAQSQSFADITMGQSIIVTALASIIIGDTFLKNSRFLKPTTRAIIGAISFKIIGGIAIDRGLAAEDLKAITAFIVIAFIAYNNASAFGVAKFKTMKRRKIQNAKYKSSVEGI
ncbi:MAG: ABC transporter permease [Tissierellia bacterium]|nr:ABC transporter permease [Tissierellia bacterium]